ncbi:MAG: PKD domain-containing protein [Aldersonia sp.]|nr:PKD domain-containing protein [Aldersonia sp.]
MTTNRTCGYLDSKSYDLGPSHTATFIRVEGGSTDLSQPGDSGAPWFVEDLAYGSHVTSAGSDGHDAIYMAINYLSDIGATVLTYDPGPGCHVPPVARMTYSQFGTQYSFDASGSYDADGSIVSYFWDFGDGTTQTTTTPYVSHSFGPGTFTVTLTVRDNDSMTGSTSVTFGTCGGPGEPDCPY